MKLAFKHLASKFVAVGILNSIVGYSIYAMLILLDVPYLVALFVATVAGVIFNYFSIGRLVFRVKGGASVFTKFIVAYVAVYSINALSLDILVRNFQVSPYIGQVSCMPLSVFTSWLLMSYWVYKND